MSGPRSTPRGSERARPRALPTRLLRKCLGVMIALSVACSEAAHVTGPVQSDPPNLAIADGARGFKEGFYWLPPMVENPTTTGVFDDALSPWVEICPVEGDGCDPDQDLVATFSMATDGSSGIQVDVNGQHYHVNWHVRSYDLSGSSHYRISVFAGERVLLGFADVEPVSNGGELKNVDTGQHIGLVDSRTLPIKFRVEKDFPAELEIAPAAVTIASGETQQFTATLIDLHGKTLDAPVAWASGDASVATVDANGLATGVGEGVTEILGVAAGLEASATLTVEPDEAPTGWAAVTAGGSHSCGIRTDGRADCWGRASSGQLGRGALLDSLRMREVEGDHRFASINAGLAHTCGITTDGDALCWGLGSFGQLGDGGTVDRTVPTPVLGGHSFASISAGYFHTCGMTTAAEALCWGRGISGELGHGVSENRSTPTAVGGAYSFASVRAGSANSCGVTTDGEAYCWGDRFFGAVGDGVLPSAGPAYEPSPVVGNLTFRSVEVGQSYTCGVTTQLVAYCWGSDSQGRLGNGSTAGSLPLPVLGGRSFAAVSPGRIHTCAVTPAGEGFCWGSGTFGQLGIGVPTPMEGAPVPVADGHEFASISAADDYHTCAVTTSAEAYCWGRGTSGQLGNGLSADQWRPVRVRDPSTGSPFGQ